MSMLSRREVPLRLFVLAGLAALCTLASPLVHAQA